MALQTAMAEARAIVASRGDGGHASASKLQSHAEVLGDKLEHLLTTGFPRGDPVIADTKRLIKTLGEMRMKVRQWGCLMQIYASMPIDKQSWISSLPNFTN